MFLATLVARLVAAYRTPDQPEQPELPGRWGVRTVTPLMTTSVASRWPELASVVGKSMLMTERKPRQQSFTSWIDQQIADAENRGVFENLPGAASR